MDPVVIVGGELWRILGDWQINYAAFVFKCGLVILLNCKQDGLHALRGEVAAGELAFNWASHLNG